MTAMISLPLRLGYTWELGKYESLAKLIRQKFISGWNPTKLGMITANPTKLREFPLLPVYIVEDHCDALPFIRDCVRSRHLMFNNNTMVHLDSHPDLLIDKDHDVDIVYKKNELYNKLSIENWILPDCFTGLFSKVCWVKPPWANQIPEGKYLVPIGSFENKVRVASPLYYFLSDGVFEDKDKLREIKEFELIANTWPSPESNCTNLLQESCFILDIDLDFFSTQNPFLELFSKGNLYEKLKPIFTFPQPPSDTPYRDIVHLSDKRKQQLEQLRCIFEHLEHHGSLEDLQEGISEDLRSKLENVISIVNSHYNNSVDLDWTILFDAGMTCDETDLPHNVVSKPDLRKAFDSFKEFLKILQFKPKIVTIARSSDDDYCPKDSVDFIQEQVLLILKEQYGDLNIQKNYLNEKEVGL